MATRSANTTLFLICTAQFLTGFGSYLVGSASGRWVVVLHATGGCALAVLLFWKARVILRSLRRRRPGLWALPSLILLGLLLATLLTGMAWSTVGLPAVAGYPAMTVHLALALAMLPFFAPHVRAGWPKPRWRDVAGRRLLLQRGALTAAGAAVWLTTEAGSRAAGLSGARRRFTGSRRVTTNAANAFPSTSWLFDDPDLFEATEWRISLAGHVHLPLLLAVEQLIAGAEMPAVLDCTGGWYAERRWSGARLRDLLDQAAPIPGARSIVIRSATGYARRFSIEDARRALLAVAVNGEPLTHGHGAPVRLVMPGKRGYEWVKWVVAVEVSRQPAFLRWPLPLR